MISQVDLFSSSKLTDLYVQKIKPGSEQRATPLFSFLSIQQDSKYSSNFSNIYLTGLKFVCLGKFSNHLLSRNDFQQMYVHKVCRYLHFNLQCAQHFDSGVELLNTHNFHKDCTMEPFIF